MGLQSLIVALLALQSGCDDTSKDEVEIGGDINRMDPHCKSISRFLRAGSGNSRRLYLG